MKKGIILYVVIKENKALAVFDNIKSASDYIKSRKIQDALISSCQYL